MGAPDINRSFGFGLGWKRLTFAAFVGLAIFIVLYHGTTRDTITQAFTPSSHTADPVYTSPNSNSDSKSKSSTTSNDPSSSHSISDNYDFDYSEAYSHGHSYSDQYSDRVNSDNPPSAANTKAAKPAAPLPTKHVSPVLLNDHEFDGLTDQQCLDTFPDLYYEVERAVKFWQSKGHTITPNDTEISWRKWSGGVMSGGDGGALKFLVHENELRILESEGAIGHWGYRGRTMGFLYLLQRAIDSAISAGELLPSVEVAALFEDIIEFPADKIGTKTFWTWTSDVKDPSHDHHWLMPNYDLWYAHPMGSFREARRRAIHRDAPFSQKLPQAVWRGSGFLNPGIREKLVEVSQGKPWSNIVIADWGGGDSDDFLTVEDYCNYQMVVHTEGVSYSGRLSYLQNCNSLIFFHDLEWRTFTTHLLNPSGPNQNYVKVARDWHDMEEKVLYYQSNPAEAEKVIKNSIDTFRNRYMTRAATSCYLRQLIIGYSKVSEAPVVDRTEKKGHTQEYRRGISFQHWLDAPQDGNFDTDEWVH